MKIYAHRGSSTIWPENTMFAFEQAHNHGAHGFETDLRLSHDGQIILSHDDNLQRFGIPDETISELTTTEICQIKIPAVNGEYRDNIITLRNLLERFPKKSYIFDCKITSETLMQKLRRLLDELQISSRIWFLTWSPEGDRLVERYFPGHPYFPRVNVSTRWAMMSLVGGGNLARPKHTILSLPAYFRGIPVFSKRQIQALKRSGRDFCGYLINSGKDYLHCLDCGVDTVLTDRPDLISELNRKHGLS